MQIVKGKYCGFCFGVKRAIETAYNLKGDKNFILGELIHNDIVNETLKNKGIITLENIDENLLSKSDNVLIRTHGEIKENFESELKKRNNKTIEEKNNETHKENGIQQRG